MSHAVRVCMLLSAAVLAMACERSSDGPSCASKRQLFAGSLSVSGQNADEQLTQLRCVQVVTGSLTIEDVESLAPLDSLVHVMGDLTIRQNDALTGLDGLEQLVEVEGDLTLEDNAKLASLGALSALEEVGGHLRLSRLAKLEQMTGLDALVQVGGDFTVQRNHALVRFDAPELLRKVDGTLTIDGNMALTNADLGDETQRGLSAGALDISSNPSLRELNLFGNVLDGETCRSFEDNLRISGNDRLEVLRLAWQQVSDACILVSDNPRLRRVSSDYLGVVRIGRLSLHRLPRLKEAEFPGGTFRSLTILATGLEELSGFESAKVDCELWIAHNPDLTEIGPFAQFAGPMADQFSVHDNPKLPACELEAAVQALPNAHVTCLNPDTFTAPATRLVVVESNDEDAICE